MYEILRYERHFVYKELFAAAVWLNPCWGFSRAWKNSGRRGVTLLQPPQQSDNNNDSDAVVSDSADSTVCDQVIPLDDSIVRDKEEEEDKKDK